jgi:hypothetical protein
MCLHPFLTAQFPSTPATTCHLNAQPPKKTLLCGLLGLPPVNGVLPQAPMHTRALATMQAQANKATLKKGGVRAAAAKLTRFARTPQTPGCGLD